MDKSDRMNMICAEVIELKDALDAYAAAEFKAQRAGRKAPSVGWDGLPRACSKTTIQRRILYLRDNLLALGKGMDE